MALGFNHADAIRASSLAAMAALLLMGSGCAPVTPPPTETTPLTPTGSMTFILADPNLSQYFPSGQDPSLPDYYKKQPNFPTTTTQSIQTFINTSLKNDGIQATATVVGTPNQAMVTITSTGPTGSQAQGYVSMLTQFIDKNHAGLGLAGTQNCQAAGNCWDTAPGKQPWSFYLPLGLPLVNQKAVMFLNYPPSDALCGMDYLNNFSIARWNTVLGRVGIPQSQYALYETTLDEHPIAAPGSGQSQQIAATTKYFYDSSNPNYDVNMLRLLLSPPAQPVSSSQPLLQVAGGDSRQIWQSITGIPNIQVNQGGNYTWPGGPTTRWLATNHPVAATYNVCPGDPTKGASPNLIPMVLQDLNSACALQAMANNPTLDPNTAISNCQQTWCTGTTGCNQQAVCIQARMDYNFYSQGLCKCQAAAAAFCQANGNNACPSTTSMTSCAPYNSLCTDPTPAYTKCVTPTTTASAKKATKKTSSTKR